MPDRPAVCAALSATCARAATLARLEPARLGAVVQVKAQGAWDALEHRDELESLGITWWEAFLSEFPGSDPAFAETRRVLATLREDVWTAALADQRMDDRGLAAALVAHYAIERRARFTLFPEAASALDELRRHGALGLVTNGPPDLQREKLAATGIDGAFGVVVVSGEVGIGKPDPRIFHLALAALGVSPEAAIHVGDSPERDVAGAWRAGIAPVWLDRAGTGWDGDARHPAAVIGSLAEIGALIG